VAEDNLGQLLRDGVGVGKNAKEAKELFTKAANQGLVTAEFHLGRMLYLGDVGVPKDVKEAIVWLEKAANAGNEYAEDMTGLAYEHGIDGKRDPKKAIYWFEKAAEAGNMDGEFNFGAAFTEGTLGVKRDAGQAYYWLSLAADQGYDLAENMLKDYRKGMTPDEIAEGERLLQADAKKNDVPPPWLPK
jgi:TPR repeat protein